MALIEPPAHLSAEAAQFLREAPEVPQIDYSDHAGIAALRDEIHAEWLQLNAQMTEPYAHRSEAIEGVPVDWFASTEADLESSRVILHLHGGSYFCGTPETNASMIVPVARRTGLPVVSVDYRLAPEHPFPAAIDDCCAVATSLVESHDVVAMYGESAGGGLALATAVALRDAHAALPQRLGLLSPWCDLTSSGDTIRTLLGVDPDFPHPDEPDAAARMYAGAEVVDPRASPLFADLADLPPTLIQVGGREILLSDSIRTAQSMRRAGTEVTLDVWDGLWHVWQLWHHVPEAVLAFDELAEFLVPTAQ